MSIKTIKIKKIELLTGLKLKRNYISIGFDTAVHSTGIAVTRTTEDSIIVDLLQKIEVPADKNILNSVDLFLSQLDELKQTISHKYKLNINIMEDCFFGSNVNTLKSLARFGILIYDRFRGISEVSKFVLPNTARNKLKFKKSGVSIKGPKLKREVMNYVNMMLNTDINDSDLADALVLALYGLVV